MFLLSQNLVGDHIVRRFATDVALHTVAIFARALYPEPNRSIEGIRNVARKRNAGFPIAGTARGIFSLVDAIGNPVISPCRGCRQMPRPTIHTSQYAYRVTRLAAVLFLHVTGAMQCIGVRPRGPMIDQSVFCTRVSGAA